LVQQQEARYYGLSKACQQASEYQTEAEKRFFDADRALSRVAENLEDIMQAKSIIESLDKEK
jgi:hypothetical protein